MLIYPNFKSLRIASFCFPNICFSFVTHFTFQIIDKTDEKETCIGKTKGDENNEFSQSMLLVQKLFSPKFVTEDQ